VELEARESPGFASVSEGRQGIENRLHWRLDVSFRAVERRVCRDRAPANRSVIRRLALSLLGVETGFWKGIGKECIECADSDAYREKVLFNC
jgi:hypothetical protein